jgi:hypothetical protein
MTGWPHDRKRRMDTRPAFNPVLPAIADRIEAERLLPRAARAVRVR